MTDQLPLPVSPPSRSADLPLPGDVAIPAAFHGYVDVIRSLVKLTPPSEPSVITTGEVGE